MPGPVALVGAGEFLPQMVLFDAELLATTGRRRPRVAIVPTATFPDGEDAFQRWAMLGVEHFAALDAEVEAVQVRDRSEADDPANAQAVGEADVVYFCGGGDAGRRPGYLLDVLAGSAVWRAALAANARGAVIVGCSTAAMALVARVARLRARFLPWPLGWRTGLGAVAGAAVFPGYDRMPEPVAALMALQAPRGTAVLGLDDATGIVGRDGSWQVHGLARVTVWRGRHRERHRAGETFRL